MKLNEYYIIGIVLFLISLLSGCSSDKEEPETKVDAITLSTSSINIGPDGGTANVVVTSSGSWRLAGESDWASSSMTSGMSGDEVAFTISSNDTNEERTATFKLFTGSSVAALTITSTPRYYLDVASDKDVIVQRDGEKIYIKLNTNVTGAIDVSLEGDDTNWITFEEQSEAFGATKLAFTIVPNETYANRNAKVVIKSKELETNVNIMQKQTDVILSDKTDFSFDDISAHELTVPLKANVNFTVESKPDWITVDEIAPIEKLSDMNLVMHLTQGLGTRSGEVVLAYEGNKMLTISVRQKNPNPQFANIPDENFRSYLIQEGWIAQNGSNYEILEKGLVSTSLVAAKCKITSLEGIESFPAITAIDVATNELKLIDLSGMNQVTSLNYTNNRNIEEVKLGDNPITSINCTKGYYVMYSKSLKISSSKLESLLMNYYDWYGAESLESLDVSECPSLKTLRCDRNKLNTIYLKEGQVIPSFIKNSDAQIIYK